VADEAAAFDLLPVALREGGTDRALVALLDDRRVVIEPGQFAAFDPKHLRSGRIDEANPAVAVDAEQPVVSGVEDQTVLGHGLPQRGFRGGQVGEGAADLDDQRAQYAERRVGEQCQRGDQHQPLLLAQCIALVFAEALVAADQLVDGSQYRAPAEFDQSVQRLCLPGCAWRLAVDLPAQFDELANLCMGAIVGLQVGLQGLGQRPDPPVRRAFEQGLVNLLHFPGGLRQGFCIGMVGPPLQLAGEQADVLRQHPPSSGQVDFGGAGPLIGGLAGEQVVGAAGQQGEEGENQGRAPPEAVDDRQAASGRGFVGTHGGAGQLQAIGKAGLSVKALPSAFTFVKKKVFPIFLP